MAKEFYVTAEGLAELQEKLDYLKNVRRPEASERIKQAREYGDLSENAEYDAAKEDQGIIEAEIRTLEAQIENAVIIDDAKAKGNRIIIGSTVTLHDIDMNEDLVYRIVGSTEANISEGLISNESPLAVAILGRKKGETVSVKDNEGDSYEVKIIDVK